MPPEALPPESDPGPGNLPRWVGLWMGLAERFGVPALVLASTAASVSASAAISVAVYLAIDPRIMAIPIALIMPVAVPLVLSPPFFAMMLVPVDRLRKSIAGHDQARLTAERANAELRELLSTIRHEVRAPLLRTASLLEGGGEPASASEAERDPAASVRYALDGLVAILDDILDPGATRRTAPDGGIPFEPRRLVASVTALLSARAEAKGVTLVHSVAEAVPHRLSGDTWTIRRILLMAAGHAIRNTAKGAVAIRVGTDEPGGGVSPLRIAVVDTGPGVVDGDGSSAAALAACGRLVEGLGGRIDIAAEPGAGTEVTLRLPARPMAEEAGGAES